MKRREANEAEKLSAEELETIKSLLNYPSLEKVFDSNSPGNLPAMKRKMRATVDDLERVIRRGTKQDAEKAAKAAEAYQIALNFLEELDNVRQSQIK